MGSEQAGKEVIGNVTLKEVRLSYASLSVRLLPLLEFAVHFFYC